MVTMPSLNIIDLTRRQHSVCADIQMLGTERFVSPALAEALIALRPSIVLHACKSAGTGYFKDRLVGATLPHAVEHLAIDLLVERFAEPSAPRHTEPSAPMIAEPSYPTFTKTPTDSTFSKASAPTFAGATTWLDRPTGIMRVRVGCASGGPYDRIGCASDGPYDQAGCANDEPYNRAGYTGSETTAYSWATEDALIEAVQIMNRLLAVRKNNEIGIY